MADQALPCLLYYLLLGLGGGMEITLRLEQLLYILKSFVIMDVHLIFHIGQYFPLCTGRLGDFRTDGPHALGGRLPADAG